MKHIKYFENIKLKPSDIVDIRTISSVARKGEAEIIAENIIVILYRTGDKFRDLSWSEYKEERIKDGNFSDIEKPWFKLVVDYCTDPEKVKTFSKKWDVKSRTERDAEKYNL